MKYHVEFDLDFKKNTYPGKFIVIEGIDGSGKTTQVHNLSEELAKKGPVFTTKNPTSGPIGKFIRDVLVEKVKVPLISIQYLYSADRQMQQEEVIERLKQGETVVGDRYFWSALAYGIVDRGTEINEQTEDVLLVAQSILSHYHQFIIPDLTVYLDIPVDVAMERIAHIEGHIHEIYEEKEKLEKISQAYAWVNKQFSQEIAVVDGTRSEKEITDIVLPLVESLKK